MQDCTTKFLLEVPQFLYNNWQPVVAYATALGAVANYFISRRRELAWKRTEFLFLHAQYLDTDKELIETITILESRHCEITIDAIYDDNSSLPIASKNEYKQKFDKLLNLFERLAYASLRAKTISMKEIGSFGWYFDLITKYPRLVAYCNENGFYDIVRIANLPSMKREYSGRYK